MMSSKNKLTPSQSCVTGKIVFINVSNTNKKISPWTTKSSNSYRANNGGSECQKEV